MPTKLHTIKSLRYVLYGLSVLPIFIFRDFTPSNELKYLSIADEAIRNGSIFTFTNHGINYADKPPLYLWIVMLGKWLLGFHNLLFLGIFSYVPALVVLYIMDKWTKNILSERERLLAQLMLLTSGFFIGTAIVLRMDMLMCMFIVLALYSFFKMYIGEGKPRDPWLFPLFIFMAIFTKGPIGIIVPLVSITVFLILKKKIKSIGKYWGWKTLLVLLTLCAIWFFGVYAEGGNQYLNNLLFNQTINRAVNSFHHQEPFYYYFAAFWYSLAPWSLLIAGILIAGLKKKLAPTDLELYFLVIAISTIATLSLFSSKLAVYMLPAFPFFVYLSALWLDRLGTPRWMLILAGIPAGILILIFPGIIVASQLPKINEVGISPLVFISGFILSCTGILTILFLKKHEMNKAIISLGTGILLSAFVVSFAIPRYNNYIGLQEICNQAKETASEKGGVNYYYCEMTIADNLNAYLGVMPEKLRIVDLYKANSSMKTPAILFTWHKAIERNDSLKVFLKDKKIHQSGGNYYIEIER
jgi:MFS family permease